MVGLFILSFFKNKMSASLYLSYFFFFLSFSFPQNLFFSLSLSLFPPLPKKENTHSQQKQTDIFHHKNNRENVSSIWTGSKLVVGGVSHGASALPASLALKSLFQTAPEVWLGQNGTGVVLFDGISNTATWEEWLYDQYEAGLDVDHLCYNLHYRTVNRYGDGGPLTHSCTNPQMLLFKSKRCHLLDERHNRHWF